VEIMAELLRVSVTNVVTPKIAFSPVDAWADKYSSSSNQEWSPSKNDSTFFQSESFFDAIFSESTFLASSPLSWEISESKAECFIQCQPYPHPNRTAAAVPASA
jgi:hypothetical protein